LFATSSFLCPQLLIKVKEDEKKFLLKIIFIYTYANVSFIYFKGASTVIDDDNSYVIPFPRNPPFCENPRDPMVKVS
jgi:hypothetical protein